MGPTFGNLAWNPPNIEYRSFNSLLLGPYHLFNPGGASDHKRYTILSLAHRGPGKVSQFTVMHARVFECLSEIDYLPIMDHAKLSKVTNFNYNNMWTMQISIDRSVWNNFPNFRNSQWYTIPCIDHEPSLHTG